MAFMALARPFHGACAALLVYTLRFHGVCTAFSRRSGTALTVCRQNRNEVSLICTFAFKKILCVISALASVCENNHAENV